jgi:hypothetical protein
MGMKTFGILPARIERQLGACEELLRQLVSRFHRGANFGEHCHRRSDPRSSRTSERRSYVTRLEEVALGGIDICGQAGQTVF